MKLWLGFSQSICTGQTLSRIYVFGLAGLVPGEDYKLGHRSAPCVSILSGLGVDDLVPEFCPFVLLYFAFCSSRPLVSPVTRK